MRFAKLLLNKKIYGAIKNLYDHVFGRAKASPLTYWKMRTAAYGRRAVLNLGHSDEEFDEVTAIQKKTIYPHFKNELTGRERLAVDLGCGPGRFTTDIALMISGRAVGLDIVPDFIEMAPLSEFVQYRTITEGVLPLPSKSVDVVWGCLVFGGLQGNVLEITVAETCRILSDNGLLFLVENTSKRASGQFWHFRSIDEYKQLFPLINLRHIFDYQDLGETISIIAGRKFEKDNLYSSNRESCQP